MQICGGVQIALSKFSDTRRQGKRSQGQMAGRMWQMECGRCQMPDARCQMPDARLQTTDQQQPSIAFTPGNLLVGDPELGTWKPGIKTTNG